MDSTASLAGGQSHSGHFTGGFESEFSQFGVALTSQLVSLPQPTPAAGFTYEFDPALGIFNRTTNNFGPIMSERAETIGARRLSAGFATQRLEFDLIEGLDLNSIPAVFSHDNAELLGGREDVVTTVNSVESQLHALDVVPDLRGDQPFRRLGGDSLGDRRHDGDLRCDDPPHRHPHPRDSLLPHASRTTSATGASSRRSATPRGSATSTCAPRPRCATPRARGSPSASTCGCPAAKSSTCSAPARPAPSPYAVWSASFGPFSPHVNVGYQWNGSSVLGGGAESGESRDLPDVVRYSVGAAIELHPRVTLAADVIGRWIIDSPRLSSQTFHALDGVTTFPDIAFRKDSLNELSAATGLKLNIVNRLLDERQPAVPPQLGRAGRQGLAAHRARVRVLVAEDVMTRFALLLSTALSTAPVAALAQAVPQPPPPPAPTATATPAIPGVAAAGTPVEVIKSGFTGTEGPVGLPDGSLIFTETQANRITRIDKDSGATTTFLENTNGSNGLGFDAKGRLISVQTVPGQTRIGVVYPKGSVATLTDNFEGKPYGRPNDLVVRQERRRLLQRARSERHAWPAADRRRR